MAQLPRIKLRPDVEEELRKTYTNDQIIAESSHESCLDRFDDLLQCLGTPPLYTTLRVNLMKTTVEEVIEELKDLLAVQYHLRGNRPSPDVYHHPVISDVIVIPNTRPVCNLAKLDKEVIVDHACGMAVLRGADIYVQGIMGAHPGMQPGDEVSVYVDLERKCRKGQTKVLTSKKIYVGNGTAQISRDAVYGSGEPRSGVGVLMTSPLYEAPSLHRVLEDRIFPQNLPSIICGHVLSPQPGQTVLDMCAAPGGKATHIAALMKNQGRVVAIDRTPDKVLKVQQAADRWDLTCIETYPYDSTKSFDITADPGGGPPYPAETFDCILLDGPCSALGQRPTSRNMVCINQFRSHPIFQRKLLYEAVELLKPGGTLVYSTCTIALQENEGQVAWILKMFPQLELQHQVPKLGGIGMQGSELTAEQLLKLQRFHPHLPQHETRSCDNDTIGFFIAKFKKTILPPCINS